MSWININWGKEWREKAVKIVKELVCIVFREMFYY